MKPLHKKLKLSFSCLLLLAICVTGCFKDHNLPPDPELKYLTRSENIANVSAAEVKLRASALALFVKNSVKVYKLTYTTKTLDGKPIQASGIVLYSENFTDSLSVLSFQHGTITTQDEAPSNYKPVGNAEAFVAATAAASLAKGYFIVMPDYLGFGESKTIQHPYQHKASLAWASLDMLRAANEFAGQYSLKLKKKIQLAGYSEGGYATMALHQEIETNASSEFPVLKSYPAAGPHDMVSTAKWVVSQTTDMPAAAASYYLWVLLTYNQIYGINAPLTDMITPVNAAKVAAAVAAGNPLAAEIDLNPSKLYTADFISGIKNSTNTKFIAALKANDVYDWKPRAPVQLFHSEGDDFVPFLNATIAEKKLQENGASATLIRIQPSTATHREAAQIYLTTMIGILLTP
ncbi:lipase family protein [Dyadobacter sp. CY345]|uniref:alpha/beta hydrolase family protein n=1 Tax=Dyadobacter sp. CY345 TaxID=2909335 RepID=UPI001F42028D|nr:lipase family protein [Dyadobacter sp. CY345]MCF2446567.1 lipase family protein [Dyadobacter sp. CY345]